MATQCNDMEALLPTYLDGELAPHDQLSFDHHMADCAECRERLRAEGVYLARMRELLAPPAPPAELVLRVREALDREDRQSRVARRRSWRTWALPSTAGLAAAAALTLLILTELSGRSVAPADDDDVRRAHHGSFNPATLVALGAPSVSRGSTPPERRRVSWNPTHARFDTWADGRNYELVLDVVDCKGLDRNRYARRMAAGAELWVARGPVNTVVYRSNPTTCLVFASDMNLDDLVDQVVRSGLVGP